MSIYILSHHTAKKVFNPSPYVFPVVSGGEVSESQRVGFRRSGRFHQRGERHAFTESPEPDPPARHRPHTAHEDGNKSIYKMVDSLYIFVVLIYMKIRHPGHK